MSVKSIKRKNIKLHDRSCTNTVDWIQIKTEYIHGEVGATYLASKFNISVETIRSRIKR